MDGAGTFNYVCDGATPASSVLSDGSAVYTPGLSERRSGTSKFTHGDMLGSTRGITNSSQTATDAILYDAFGMTVSRTASTPTPFGFVGDAQYQTDADSGLMLLGHRYYDASIGRFISQDPIKAGDNWYAYCGNNPLVRIDPEGLWPDKDKRNRMGGNDPRRNETPEERQRKLKDPNTPTEDKKIREQVQKGKCERNKQKRNRPQPIDKPKLIKQPNPYVPKIPPICVPPIKTAPVIAPVIPPVSGTISLPIVIPFIPFWKLLHSIYNGPEC